MRWKSAPIPSWREIKQFRSIHSALLGDPCGMQLATVWTPPPAPLKGVKVMSTHGERRETRRPAQGPKPGFGNRHTPQREMNGTQGGKPGRPPRAQLTSMCLALNTMPCAPSPMRPRMQYWSIARPPAEPGPGSLATGRPPGVVGRRPSAAGDGAPASSVLSPRPPPPRRRALHLLAVTHQHPSAGQQPQQTPTPAAGSHRRRCARHAGRAGPRDLEGGAAGPEGRGLGLKGVAAGPTGRGREGSETPSNEGEGRGPGLSGRGTFNEASLLEGQMATYRDNF